MRRVLPILIPVLALPLVACSSKTPEEQEAAKYQQVKPLSPEEQKAVEARTQAVHRPPAGQ